MLVDALVATGLARPTRPAVLLGLLLEVVVDLGTVPPTILVVVACDGQRTRHGSEAVLLVVIADLDVDHVVTGHVGQLRVLLPHPSPCGQVTIQLVIYLVQHQEPQLGIVELLDEVTAIDLVLAVRVCGWAACCVCLDAALADHHHTSQRHILGVGHDIHDSFVETLFGGKCLI